MTEIPSHPLGSAVRLRSPHRRPGVVVLTMPGGTVVPVDSGSSPSVVVQATVLGVWSWDWGEGATGGFLVQEAPATPAAEAVTRVLSHPLSSSRVT